MRCLLHLGHMVLSIWHISELNKGSSSLPENGYCQSLCTAGAADMHGLACFVVSIILQIQERLANPQL